MALEGIPGRIFSKSHLSHSPNKDVLFQLFFQSGILFF